MKRSILNLILPLWTAATILSGSVLAQGVSYKGTSAANFLKVAMGAAFVGSAESDLTLAKDASSLWFNPGTISRIPKSSAVFSHSSWLVQTNFTNVAVTLPFGGFTAGVDLTYFGSGDIEETTLLKQDGTGRVVSASDLALGAALARNLTDRFSVGCKLKYIREQLAQVTAGAFAFDIGSVFETSFFNNMKIGIALTNFGGALQFSGNDLLVTHVVSGSPTNKQIPAVLETKEWDMPMTFRLGVATDIINRGDVVWSGSYAINDARDFGTRHNLGTTLTLKKMLALRAGYRLNYDEATLSAGAGLLVPASFLGQVYFDYAYTDFGQFSNIHQFSVAVNF
ncbi:MAG TPA: PorV/PorQ family protein [bacterium]|nr:PorV/PorQ family protein [bacterium]HQG46815.1 PorV/PorQ family protein [bacterium]HQI49136.1 PorV/PorQ family protein [bacterium]HQJ64645.1 PorV/PorQ family protein [bacterium]